MQTSCQPDDLGQLRATFGDQGWTFESQWVAAGSGPDQRRLHARKGDVTLSAWHIDDLVAQIAAAVHTAALKGDDEA
jgi:hypothetical protein